MRMRLLPLALLLTLCTAGAQAGKVYKWKDSNGIVHYGDRPPAASTTARELTVIPFRAEPGALVRLRLTQEGGQYLAWVDNAWAGPVEVRLDFGHSSNVRGEPQLPARATVPGSGNALVARIVGIHSFAVDIVARPFETIARLAMTLAAVAGLSSNSTSPTEFPSRMSVRNV